MYRKPFQELSLPAMGFGVLRLPTVEGDPNCIDRTKGQEIFDFAMANGMNYFDSGYIYQKGDSERFIGEALKKYPRESYHLATKYYPFPDAKIEEMFEEQLKRCQTDYFDFYLLHGLDEDNMQHFMDPHRRCLEFMLDQKEKGRIRKIGFSSHAAPETLRRFLDWYAGFDMALIQVNYVDWTMLDAKGQYEALTACGIPVWVMEPQKGGRLVQLNEEAKSILKTASPNRSIASWGFRFLMTLPNVQMVLSGMSSLEQLQDNLNTFSALDPLSEQELTILEKAKAAFLRDMGVPCSACRYCCDTCPAGLDIPLLIKGYNEKNISGSTWRVPMLETAGRAADCVQCGACAEHCPQNIDIPKIMQELQNRE